MERHKKIKTRFGTLSGSSPFGLVSYTLWLQEDLLLFVKMIHGWRGCYAPVAIILKCLPVITQIHQKNLKEVEYPKFGCAVCFHSQGKLF